MNKFWYILLGITAPIWIIPVLLGVAVVCSFLMAFTIMAGFLTSESVEIVHKKKKLKK